jgi:hypothetical protein
VHLCLLPLQDCTSNLSHEFLFQVIQPPPFTDSRKPIYLLHKPFFQSKSKSQSQNFNQHPHKIETLSISNLINQNQIINSIQWYIKTAITYCFMKNVNCSCKTIHRIILHVSLEAPFTKPGRSFHFSFDLYFPFSI